MSKIANEKPQVETNETEEQEEDDGEWIEKLEPYQSQPIQTNTTEEVKKALKEDVDNLDDDELRKKYEALEYTDGDVAFEMHKKVIAPEINAVRAEIDELKRLRAEDEKRKQDNLLSSANSEILKRYPKADKILQSRDFVEFVNQNSNPYSTDTNFDMLMKAYYAGDAKYVLSRLDEFSQSRGKPRPPVGVEPVGSRSASYSSSGKQPMSDEEYLRLRQKIKSAPKGTFPNSALKDLVNEYMSSNRG